MMLKIPVQEPLIRTILTPDLPDFPEYDGVDLSTLFIGFPKYIPLKGLYLNLKNFQKGMKNKKLFIYGVGGFAEYAAYVFENDSDYEVVGTCIEKNYLENNPRDLNNLNVYEEIEDLLLQEHTYLFIAVGNNVVRERIYQMSKQKSIKMATYNSSKASTWANLEIGDNCFIGEGSVIQPFVRIGSNSIFFSARIGHHCLIGDHVLLSGPTIGGNVRIGNFSFLGLNSVVLQKLEIGPKNIIGMGVSIKTSTGEGDVYSSATFIKRKVKFDDISKNYLN